MSDRNNRIYAILNIEKEDFDVDTVFNILSEDKNAGIYFFTTYPDKAEKAEQSKKFVEVYLLPPEIIDSESKIRNFAYKTFFDKKCDSFVHFVSDMLPLKSENIMEFVPAIEDMMSKLNQISWFSTRSDVCNYVFEKYNPKFKIFVDEENTKQYNRMIFFTAFANLAWVTFDYSKVDDFIKIKLDDDFKIPMFFIVEYLSRRREYQPAFINCYPSIEEERWVFDTSSMFKQKLKPSPDKFSRSEYEKDNALFGKKNIDFKPMGNIEKAFEMICDTLGIDPLGAANEIPEIVEESEEPKNEN